MCKRICIKVILVIALFSNYLNAEAKAIIVKNPGSDKNISPMIQEAVDSAEDGDVLILPGAAFAINETVIITRFVSIRGQGIQKTMLYWNKPLQRTKSLPFGELSIFNFKINSVKASGIVVSGIYFKGMASTLQIGDGKSFLPLAGVKFLNCNGFTVENCRFDYFGYAGVAVFHQDTLANGLIRNNQFYHNAMRGSGYGVAVYGENKVWVDDPKLGSSNFIFVEDNVFEFHRHSIASGGGSLFVFRHNYVLDNIVRPGGHAVDTHEARETTATYNSIGSRASEVYDNIFINRKDINGKDINDKSDRLSVFLEDAAVAIRSGDAVVFNNQASGYKWCVKISNWYLEGTEQEYPVFGGSGYMSGKKLGPDHRGNKPPQSDGDTFVWNNKVRPASSGKWNPASFINTEPAWWIEGRDYHLQSRPGYKPYPYPYPYPYR